MSFGLAIGDIATVGQLCWKVYKRCKDAPGNYKELTSEVGALHNVIKETEELVAGQTMSPGQKKRLDVPRSGCLEVLKDLDRLLTRYESLGTRSQRTFDRMGFGMNNISEIRTRLISNVTLLDAFINASSHARLEHKLNLLISEARAGKREGSVISTISLDPASRNEREIWADLQRELEDVGISASIINDNKQFIVAWFQEAIKCGELEEETSYDDVGEIDTSYDDIGDHTKCGELEVNTFHEDTGDDNRLPHQYHSNEINDQNQINTDHGRPPNSSSLGHLFSQYPLPAQRVGREGNPASGIDQSRTRPVHGERAVQPSSRQRKAERSVISSLSNETRSKDTLKDTWLFEAIESRNSDEVASLLTKGASVTANTRYRETPLHRAVMVGHIGIMKALCHQGADINARTRCNRTPLHFIVNRLSGEGIRVLLQFGADTEAVDSEGATPLHKASKLGNISVIRTLLEAGANTHAKTANGWTALHMSVGGAPQNRKIFQFYLECMKLLLEHGAKVNEKTNEGNTAGQLGMRGKRTKSEYLKLLEEYGVRTTRKSAG